MMEVLGAAALAAAPVEGLRAVVARPGAADDFRAWLVSNHRPETTLACTEGWAGLASLCFRIWEPAPGDPVRRSRRWVTAADLTAWATDAVLLRAALGVAGREHVAQATTHQIEGISGEYLKIVDGDGWSASALLAPDALAARLGGPPIAVALPSDTVMLAWKPGNDQVDLIMAVGVHEVFAAAEAPVTEVVHRWDGTTWTAWAMTLPATPSP